MSVRHIEITDKAVEGQRIDNFLLRITGRTPRACLQNFTVRGSRVNGGRVSPSYRLTLGDVVRVLNQIEGKASIRFQTSSLIFWKLCLT